MVVVLATPPFWLASVITLQVDISEDSDALGNSYAPVFAGGTGIPPHRVVAGRAVCSSVVPGLLDRRLIFVTGKGGVGKSTVATALGVLAARHGLRTIVAELASQARIRDAFDARGRDLRGGRSSPSGCSHLDRPAAAMEEYLRVKTGAVGQALGSSRLFQAFAMATPGMRELLSIGKVWELAQPERRTAGAEAYDLVIVDSPAAGHGVGDPAHPADVRRDRPGGSDRPSGPHDRRHDRRSRLHRRGRRGHRRGDAGQRDAVAARRAGRARRSRSTRCSSTRATPSASPPRERKRLEKARARAASPGPAAAALRRRAVRAGPRRGPAASSCSGCTTGSVMAPVELPVSVRRADRAARARAAGRRARGRGRRSAARVSCAAADLDCAP